VVRRPAQRETVAMDVRPWHGWTQRL